MAERLWTEGRYEAAVSEFEKAAAKDAHGKLGLQALYRAAVTQELYLLQYDSAISKFKLIAENNMDPALAWDAQKQIGEIYFSKTDQYESAARHYSRLLREHPGLAEEPEFTWRVAKSYFFLSQFDEALSQYGALHKKYPKSLWGERALYEQGVTLFTRGEHNPGGKGHGIESYQEAMDVYQRFVKNYPKSKWVPEAYFGIGNCLEELDQLDAAYHRYEALLNTYPSPKVIRIKLERIKERISHKSRTES